MSQTASSLHQRDVRNVHFPFNSKFFARQFRNQSQACGPPHYAAHWGAIYVPNTALRRKIDSVDARG